MKSMETIWVQRVWIISLYRVCGHHVTLWWTQRHVSLLQEYFKLVAVSSWLNFASYQSLNQSIFQCLNSPNRWIHHRMVSTQPSKDKTLWQLHVVLVYWSVTKYILVGTLICQQAILDTPIWVELKFQSLFMLTYPTEFNQDTSTTISSLMELYLSTIVFRCRSIMQ